MKLFWYSFMATISTALFWIVATSGSATDTVLSLVAWTGSMLAASMSVETKNKWHISSWVFLNMFQLFLIWVAIQ